MHKNFMKKKITFIIPTKNRVVLLNSFFKNIYKNFNKLNPKYVIVDASNEQNHSQNKLNLKKYKNIKEKYDQFKEQKKNTIANLKKKIL